MKAQKAVRDDMDPVLAALEAAPAVPLSDEEAHALELAKAESKTGWRAHDEVLAKLARSKE